jgi:hypothetical protein
MCPTDCRRKVLSVHQAENLVMAQAAKAILHRCEQCFFVDEEARADAQA